MPWIHMNGTTILELNGSPEAMGNEHGRLHRDAIHTAINDFLKQSERLFEVPYPALRQAALQMLPYIPDDYRVELTAMAQSAGVDFVDLLAFNCVVDVDSNYMQKLYHCCNFVVAPPATTGGFFHGRNLDFPHGDVLNQVSTVVLRKPQRGYGTIGLAWAGYAGFLTGMNSKGLTFGEVSAASRQCTLEGMPLALLARWVLESSENSNQSFHVLEGARPTGGYNVAMADPNLRVGVAIELTARLCERRQARRGAIVVDDVCLCKNTGRHRLTSVSGALRFARMTQLVREHYGTISTDLAIQFLSDSWNLATGRNGLRSYNTICNHHTVQSVLFVPDELIMHAALGKVPAPSGGYAVLDLRGVWGEPPIASNLVSQVVEDA